ncbi:MAG: hypothetical protein KF716_12290 [Anaerolineae bacterium]|nr:hypothetical protein [Anaerolineae bacterium]
MSNDQPTSILQGVTATINNLNAAEDQKAALEALFSQLESTLRMYASSHPAETSQIATLARASLDQLAAADRDSLKSSVNALKAAANNIRELMPAVFGVAITIAGSLLRLGS